MRYGESRQIEGQIESDEHCAEMVSVFVEYRVDERLTRHNLKAGLDVVLHDIEVLTAQVVVIEQHVPPQLISIIDTAEAQSQRLPSVRRGLGIKDHRPV